MTLVPSRPPDDHDIDSLRLRLSEIEALLGQRATEIDRARTDLAAFRIRYRRDVGLLHEELEDLERAIAEAELGELSKLTVDTDPPVSPAVSRVEPPSRYTSDAVRRLFRDVAKTIHPDLARDDVTRDRRHALMVEANRAYALGDEERLRSILDAWHRSPEAVEGRDPDATRARLARRIAELQDQLNACTGELAAMQETPLWKLKVMVDAASARGKDLVADMARRLKRDIVAARNRLDAMTLP